jgi:23S rRNA pseudouridine2605 synthase
MKTNGRPPRKTTGKYNEGKKKSTGKTFDKAHGPSDSKFNRTEKDGYQKKKKYSERSSTDEGSSTEKRPYKKRDSATGGGFGKPKKRYDEGRKHDDDRSSDKKPYQKRESFGKDYERAFGRDDNRKRDGKKFTDKKPYTTKRVGKNDNDRPIEKYVDKRKRYDNIENSNYTIGKASGHKRPRIVKSKNYEGRKHEYKETEILVKDNTYEKRPSFRGKSDSEGIRLNKFIANAGICSRREADTLIEAGAISVNGVVVTQLGTKVMPDDQVKYGDQILMGEQLQYLLLNKPKGYLTTTDDPQERKTVMMIVDNACKERIYPVGRLDKNTSGLLLFTNDGELAKKLTHPKHQVEKIYHAELDKNLTIADMKKITAGIELDDGYIKVDTIAYGDSKKEVGIELHSGKNRIVRRIFESLGYEVVKLDRVVFAGLTKKDLPRGKYRFLSNEEVNILRRIR